MGVRLPGRQALNFVFHFRLIYSGFSYLVGTWRCDFDFDFDFGVWIYTGDLDWDWAGLVTLTTWLFDRSTDYSTQYAVLSVGFLVELPLTRHTHNTITYACQIIHHAVNGLTSPSPRPNDGLAHRLKSVDHPRKSKAKLSPRQLLHLQDHCVVETNGDP